MPEHEAPALRSTAADALGPALAATDGSGAACAGEGGAKRGTDCRRFSAASTLAALGRTLGFAAMHACHRSATPCGQSSGTLPPGRGSAETGGCHRPATPSGHPARQALGLAETHDCHRSATACGQSSGTLRTRLRPALSCLLQVPVLQRLTCLRLLHCTTATGPHTPGTKRPRLRHCLTSGM